MDTFGIKSKSCGIYGLRKNRCKPKQEEFYISYPSELCPKGFNFSIERFRRSVCTSIVKIVEYILIMNGHSSGYGTEALKSRLSYFFMPFS
jgi:hypothetical protein